MPCIRGFLFAKFPTHISHIVEVWALRNACEMWVCEFVRKTVHSSFVYARVFWNFLRAEVFCYRLRPKTHTLSFVETGLCMPKARKLTKYFFKKKDERISVPIERSVSVFLMPLKQNWRVHSSFMYTFREKH